MATAEIAALRAERERIRVQHASGAPGSLTVRRLSDALDTAIAAVWSRAGAPPGVAVVALGEFGRREVSPFSSVELLVLHPPAAEVGHVADLLADELGSAEVDVGSATATPEEALAQAHDGFEAELGLLDARWICGDEVLVAGWEARLREWVGRDPEAFRARLSAAVDARRSSTDDACATLEPDLMDGAGGLADLAAWRWVARVDPGATERAGAMAPLDVDAAADLLHRARNELHYLTGRATEVLQLPYQAAVGEVLLPAGVPAPEMQLLRTLYGHGRTVAFALDAALRPDLVAGPGPVGRLIASFTGPARAPGRRWVEANRRAFLELLASGPGARAGLRALDRTGALEAAIPEWSSIRCLPQRSVYHRHAVDVHSFEVAVEVAELAGSADELTRSVALEAQPDWETLLLAGLLHDVGKGAEEDHSVRGERLARSAGERMGLTDAEVADVAWLARNHLLLSRAATRRDIGDEGLTREVAARIGSERRLRLLYLLTVADARATGPAAWSAWKATLISRLYGRINAALRRSEARQGDGAEGGAAQGSEQEVEGRLAVLRRALATYPPSAVQHHIANMPRAWLLSQDAARLVAQSEQVMGFDPPSALSLRLVADPETGVWELTVVAGDRPGLLSKISGVLALHGLSALGAEAFTWADGVALSIWQVEAVWDGDPDGDGLTDDIRRALAGRLSIDARLAEHRRRHEGEKAGATNEARPEPEIEVDDDASERFTVIEVRAADRVGLLYTITRALVEMDLDIHIAKVATYGEEVVDVFYVRPLRGGKVEGGAYAAEIARSIVHHLVTA